MDGTWGVFIKFLKKIPPGPQNVISFDWPWIECFFSAWVICLGV